MKSHERRIKDAAAEFGKLVREFPTSYSNEEIATRLLEAADREAPKWPTDDQMRQFAKAWMFNEARWIELDREKMRAAMLADPIIRAAIEMRHVVLSATGPVGPDDARAVQAVIDAVREAGL